MESRIDRKNENLRIIFPPIQRIHIKLNNNDSEEALNLLLLKKVLCGKSKILCVFHKKSKDVSSFQNSQFHSEASHCHSISRIFCRRLAWYNYSVCEEKRTHGDGRRWSSFRGIKCGERKCPQSETIRRQYPCRIRWIHC